jgi:hypothetical protein
MFTETLPSDSPFIVDVITDRYEAPYIHFRDRCIATASHATIFMGRALMKDEVLNTKHV